MEYEKKALRLLNLIQGVLFIGFVNPLFSLAVKIAAHDYGWLKQMRHNIPPLDTFFKQNPHLDLSRNFPNLGKISWHPFNPELGAADDYAYMGVMFRMAMACLLLLISTFFLRKRILHGLQPVIAWRDQPSFRRERLLIFWFCFVLCACYPLKLHLGFWFPGIGGWSYESRQSHVVDTPVAIPDGLRLTGDQIPEFLASGLVLEHRSAIENEGFLGRNLMFLHFAGGEVLPANYDLLNMVFPRYVFGKDYQQILYPDEFAQIVSYSLARRQKGKRSFLPLGVSYPNHAVYMPVDYQDYPPAATLEKISFWHLTVRLENGVATPALAQAANWMEIHVR